MSCLAQIGPDMSHGRGGVIIHTTSIAPVSVVCSDVELHEGHQLHLQLDPQRGVEEQVEGGRSEGGHTSWRVGKEGEDTVSMLEGGGWGEKERTLSQCMNL